jgi:hypothetical protein
MHERGMLWGYRDIKIEAIGHRIDHQCSRVELGYIRLNRVMDLPLHNLGVGGSLLRGGVGCVESSIFRESVHM